jgi:phosphatidylserine decarboxylase
MGNFFWADAPSHTAYPVARAGFPFMFTAAFATAVFALLGWASLALFGLLSFLFISFFFRDPDRVIPLGEGCIVSPADGRIISIVETENSRFYEGRCLKISIFMSIFNVHVNRVPHEGRITKIEYHPGKYFSANMDKASKNNERNAVFLETKKGDRICFVQIAGLVARRILCHIQKGDMVQRGQRFGMICFGSRVDLYLPYGTSPLVGVGDRVKAGTSLLGEIKSDLGL